MKVVRNISGKQIQRLRKKYGLSRKGLCSRIRKNGGGEYTTKRIRAMEEGREMVFDTDIWAISQALGVMPEEFFPMEKLLAFLFD